MARYSDLDRSALAVLEDRYGWTIDDAEPLSGGMANSSYRLTTSVGPIVATALDNHDEVSARQLIDLLVYLAKHGVSTPVPLAANDGHRLQRIGNQLVVVKPYVEGTQEHPLLPQHVETAGRSLAQVHLLQPPPWLVQGGRQLPIYWRDEVADAPLGLEALLADAQVHVGSLQGLPSGLVHGDLFDDNVIVNPDSGLTLLDWETASVEPFVFDIGMTIIGMCRVGDRIDDERAKRLLVGYEQVRPITPEERKRLLPSVLVANALLMFHRYVRHNITHPDPAKSEIWRELAAFAASMPARGLS